ncbi:MAG: hypothetical protein AAF961_14035, partial [Planctomycetota bacterium]
MIHWVGDVRLNESGDLALLAGFGDNAWALVAEDDAGFEEIVQSRDVMPGAEAPLRDVGKMEFINAQHVVFSAQFEENEPSRYSYGTGIWTYESGRLTPITYSGQALAGGEVVTYVDYVFSWEVNSSGDVGFMTTSQGPNDEEIASLWKYHEGSSMRLLQSGDRTPGTEAEFSRLVRSPRFGISPSGDIGFPFEFNDPERTIGIWIANDEDIRSFALPGDAIAEMDATIVGVGYPGYVGDDIVAFPVRIEFAARTGDPIGALLMQRSGELHMALREGEALPGVSDTVSDTAYFNHLFNNAGTLAFVDHISDFASSSFRPNSLWIDVVGEPYLVLRAGDAIDVGDGEDLIVESIRQFRLNEAGQLAVIANLAGGRQAVLLSEAFAIPEPSTLAIALLLTTAGSCYAWAKRRRERRRRHSGVHRVARSARSGKRHRERSVSMPTTQFLALAIFAAITAAIGKPAFADPGAFRTLAIRGQPAPGTDEMF